MCAPTKIGPKRLKNITIPRLSCPYSEAELVERYITTRFRLQNNEETTLMKQLFLTLSLALTAGSAFAQNTSVVRWNQIVGVITAPGIDNPVGGTTDASGNKINQIHGGAGPWTARGGSARVNLSTGEGSFDVDGLVLNGGNASGTPGPINSVVGTLVCNAGTAAQAILDTPATDLSPKGNADLSFRLNVPGECANPLFLIRIPQAGLRWIATGTVPVTANSSGY